MNFKSRFFISFLTLFFYGCSITGSIKNDDGSSNYFASTKGKKNLLKNDDSVKVGEFSNGITYYIKDNKYPKDRLELLLVVDAGSVLEDDDQQGLAHFAEHMAFNGTDKYPKQELVDYLESIGMKFGPDLNAYTSFDETVYMLQLPVDDEKIVEKGFEILSEWAFNISFDDDEIDKERGVIVEEWRLRRGADQRIRDKKLPIYFKDSKYAERTPIGKMEIVENFEYDVIKRFYKDWYRPDLMAVVAVGDYDTDKIEAYIEKYFDLDNKPENPRKRVVEEVPSFHDYRVAIGSDPELAMPSVGVSYFYDPYEGELTEEIYKKGLIKQMITSMINMRLSDLAKKENPDFIYSGSYNVGRYIRSKEMYVFYAGVQENKISQGFESLVREIERVIQHGFVSEELNRTKSKFLNDLKLASNEKDKTESRRFKFKYKDHYLSGKPYLSIEDQLFLFNLHSESITLNDINLVAKEMFLDNNKVLDFDIPDKEDLEILTEEDVVDIYNKVLSETIAPYVEETIDVKFFSKNLDAGSIIAEEVNKVLDTKELTLSNGIKVVYKKTDFKNDEILFTAFSPGGHSLISDDKYFAASEASSIVSYSGLGPFNQAQLDKFLSDKNVKVEPYINELTEGVKGASNIKDLELMFQMIHLYLTEPKEDISSFNSYIERMTGFIQNKNLSPENVFFDSVATIINSNHFRSKSLSVSDLNKITLDDVMYVYKDRFEDLSDFTFVFVGNIDEELLVEYVNNYLGSINTLNRNENWKDVGMEFPDSVVNHEIFKGLDEKSFVYLNFTDDVNWNENEVVNLKTFTNAFKIKLREVLREEMGGTYGVWVLGSLNQYPNSKYVFRVLFGCDPDKVDILTDALMNEINSVRENGLDEKYLNKAKEIQINEFDKNLRENKYWLGQIESMHYNNSTNYMMTDYPELFNGINNDELILLANKYLNTDNYVKVVLFPENKDSE